MKCIKKMIPHVTKPRLGGWLFAAALLIGIIATVSPQQLPVVIYKLALITLAAVLGYWLDRSLFPDSSPGQLMTNGIVRASADDLPATAIDWCVILAAALIRRSLIVAAVCLSVAIGL